jgi:hypothetical protein
MILAPNAEATESTAPIKGEDIKIPTIIDIKPVTG